MARNAEKKALESAAFWQNILQVFLTVLNVIYVMAVVYQIKSSDGEWTFMMLLWPIIYGYLEYKGYQMLISELESGLKPNYSLDGFAVITGSHFCSIFSSDIGTYVLYLVPMYLIYKVGGYAFSYLKSKSDSATTEDNQEVDASEAKR